VRFWPPQSVASQLKNLVDGRLVGDEGPLAIVKNRGIQGGVTAVLNLLMAQTISSRGKQSQEWKSHHRGVAEQGACGHLNRENFTDSQKGRQ